MSGREKIQDTDLEEIVGGAGIGGRYRLLASRKSNTTSQITISARNGLG